jgi:hypothetical protein
MAKILVSNVNDICIYCTIVIYFECISIRRSRDLRPPPMTKHPYYYFLQANDASEAGDGSISKPNFDYQSEIWTKPMTITKYPGKERQVVIEEGAKIPLSESLR